MENNKANLTKAFLAEHKNDTDEELLRAWVNYVFPIQSQDLDIPIVYESSFRRGHIVEALFDSKTVAFNDPDNPEKITEEIEKFRPSDAGESEQ